MERKFYHNAFATNGDTFVSLKIFHQKFEPFPIPHNAFDNLEVIFSDTTAKVNWNKPALLGGMAQGAWQQWVFEIRVEDAVLQNSTAIVNLTESSCVLQELSPNTVYKINVRAYNKAGKGPWCSQFIGSTFKSIDLRYTFPTIVWGTRDGLLQSNIVGDDIVSLLNTIKLNRMAVRDVTWFKDSIFINANYTTLFVYNTSTYSFSKISNIFSIKSIAIDWITPKIYCSNPVNQMISRMNLDGSHIETLPMMTLAKEIAVDANN
ncbi:proto-oncogene tyrosine-protein kinase ROS-like protein, partial [Leptotrombidium deliense]